MLHREKSGNPGAHLKIPLFLAAVFWAPLAFVHTYVESDSCRGSLALLSSGATPRAFPDFESGAKKYF
jgi:hypothetical protein